MKKQSGYESTNSGLLVPSREIITQETSNRYVEHSFEAHLGNKAFGCLYYESKQPVDDVPLVLIPGFMETRSALKPLAREMAILGKDTVVYPPLRQQAVMKLLTKRHLTNVLSHQMQVVHSVMKATTEMTGATAYDKAGHSMGNAILMGVAYHELVRKPNAEFTVRSGVSDAGAGLDTEGALNGLIKMAGHLGGIVRHELVGQVPNIIKIAPEDMMDESKEHIKDVGRAIREGLHVVAYPNVQKRLRRIRARKEIAYRYGALLPEFDQFFLEQDVRDQSGHLLDRMVQIPGAYHVHANTDPAGHAQYLFDMLMDLNYPNDDAEVA